MSEPSPELSAMLRQALRAFEQRDPEALERVLSRSDVLRIVGTDPREWFAGNEAVEVNRAQVEELPRLELSFQDLEGFSQGAVGWAAARCEFMLDDGSVIPMRVTITCVLESETWRIVQFHASQGVPNEESLGISLTTSLNQLLASLGPETNQQIRSSVTEGIVTLVFTDIERSSELSERIGDLAWAELIGWHDAMLKTATELERGSVVKTLGDGAMLAFASARSAVRTAVEIQEAVAARSDRPPFRVRIGIHTGETVITDADYLGHAVNKAARIAAAAEGGEIMTSAVVRDLVGDSAGIGFGEPISVELKGLSGTHLITRVIW